MVSFTRTKIALSGFLFLLSLGQKVAAQDNKLQTLAQLYRQGHYKLVYRKAGRLLMNPTYDQNKEPAQYRQLAALELAKNPNWSKRHAQELAWIEKPVHTSTEQNFQIDFQTQQLRLHNLCLGGYNLFDIELSLESNLESPPVFLQRKHALNQKI